MTYPQETCCPLCKLQLMDQRIPKDETEKRMREIGLRNNILKCEDGILALQRYKKLLEKTLEVLQNKVE